MVGDTLDSVKHDCNIIINSDNDPDPSKFNDREWLASPYTLDGKTIYALVHMEYWGTLHPGQCPSGDREKCVNTSITLAISTDKGRTYSHATAPDHLVATLPYPYEPDAGPSHIACPSNIIYNPKDGYYYVMFYMALKSRQDAGTGIMRTKTLDDPKSWRAWNGSDFTVQFIDPYQNPDADPAEHICQPVSRQEILYMSSSLTFNTYFNKFILVGIVATGYTMQDRGVPGFYYSLSDDLIHWTPRKLIMAIQFPPGVVPPAGGNPEDAPCLTYVSLIDPEDTSRNFEITGQRPYLYCVRVNPTSPSPRERQLVRIPIEFAPPSPAPAPTPSPEPTEITPSVPLAPEQAEPTSTPAPALTTVPAIRDFDIYPEDKVAIERAEADIELNRKGDVLLTVTDSQGRPIGGRSPT